MIMSCAVLRCEELPYDLESNSLRATLTWRGLSGSSDDLLWATLAMLSWSTPRFLDLEYRVNGARGAVQLYAEAEKHFAVRSGNTTSLYWDTNKRYQSTISVTLWITASCELYQKTGEARYLENGLSGFRGLTQLGLISHGQVFDGVHTNLGHGTLGTEKWTYNAGVALGALTELYRSTNDVRFLTIGQEIAELAVTDFWETNGEHLHELRGGDLNTDQFSFKGILLHYLARFVRVLSKTGRLDLAWARKLKATCQQESSWLVAHRLRDDGFCVYWGEPVAQHRCNENSSYPPQGMVGASQLFMLTDQLQHL
jgi:predicted alpha-1,6-mannanase (GH76 family)